MYKIILTKIKPNIETKFYNELLSNKDDYISYFNEHYKKTGKFISAANLNTDNPLEEKKLTIWNSRKDFQDFLTDKEIYKERSNQNAYESEFNIKTIVEVEYE